MKDQKNLTAVEKTFLALDELIETRGFWQPLTSPIPWKVLDRHGLDQDDDGFHRIVGADGVLLTRELLDRYMKTRGHVIARMPDDSLQGHRKVYRLNPTGRVETLIVIKRTECNDFLTGSYKVTLTVVETCANEWHGPMSYPAIDNDYIPFPIDSGDVIHSVGELERVGALILGTDKDEE